MVIKNMAKTNKELLAQAIEEGLARRFEKVLADAPDFDGCSPEHLKRMESIVNRHKNHRIRSFGLIAAIIAAALLLFGCTIYHHYEELKELDLFSFDHRFMNFNTFTVERGEEYDVVLFHPDGTQTNTNENKTDQTGARPSTIEEPYFLSRDPKGYSLMAYEKYTSLLIWQYQNKKGDILTFEQTPIPQEGPFSSCTHPKSLILSAAGYEVRYCVDEQHVYTWNDGKYELRLLSPQSIASQELSRIISGVALDQTPTTEYPIMVEQPYTLSYIPEGFSFTSATRNPLLHFLRYTNTKGEILEFNQSPISKAGIIVDNEKGEIKIFNIDTYEIYHYCADKANFYIWTDGKYELFLFSTVAIQQEELVKILNGMSPKEK